MKITVVGAGIIGCAVAYELAARGASVRMVDMRGAGLGATQASAGMLAPYVEGHIDALLHLGVSSLALYDDFVARISDAAGRPIEYERSGTLHVASTDEEGEELETATRRFSSNGVANTLMTGDAARRLEPALATHIRSAMLIPAHGYVRAQELTDALAAAAFRLGVTLECGVVNDIQSADGVATVKTTTGKWESDAVVVAAGSWTSRLPATPRRAGSTQDAVRPVRGQLLHLHFPARPLSRVVWGTGCYLVPWRDGTLLVGATVEEAGYDERATVAGVSHLLRSGGEVLAGISSAGFDGVRVGLRPGTPDELPLIGPSSTMRGVFYATGHYRNGVLLSPLTARLVADLVIDNRPAPELDLVRPDRFGL